MFLSQNILIPSNHIQPTLTESIFTPSSSFYHFYYFLTLSIKIVSVPFFSFSDKHQSHHLVGCLATDINSLLMYFLNALCCVYSLYNIPLNIVVDKIYNCL